jgi:hypothetical protein
VYGISLDADIAVCSPGFFPYRHKKLINSSLKQSISSKEVTGGDGAMLQYEYVYGKKLEASIEDCRFDETYIALQNGTTISTALQDFYIFDEIVTLAAGAGSVAQTPTSKIYVEKPDNTIVTVTPTAKAFTVSGLTTEKVKVSYRYQDTIDSITINADDFPKSYELTMFTKICDKNGVKANVQIIIPQFKLSGSLDISLTQDGVSTSKMDGKALAADDDATGKQYYAKVLIKPVTGSAVVLTGIAVTPPSATLDVSDGDTLQLEVIGIQGGIKANINNPSGTTFASSDATKATVGETTGLVTAVAAGTTIITATNGSFTDEVNITVQA